MNKYYTPLHVHSDASLLDGLSKTKDITKRLKEIQAIGGAISDHGVVSNVISFLKEMDKAKLKPILGIELYISPEHASIQTPENRKCSHLVILAKNTKGWKQILKIVAEANQNYYYRPRLSLEQLAPHLDGNIIGFSGHLGSDVANSIMEFGEDAGEKTAIYLNRIFGAGNFWLECQLMDSKHNPEQIKVTDIVRSISKKTGIPCIATPDAHYSKHEDSELQRILLCSNMGVNMKKAMEPDFQLRAFFISDNFHIPTYDEMISYGHTIEELENTNKILDQIETYDILSEPQLPAFSCPDGMTEDGYVLKLCRQGWQKFIAGKVPKEKEREYADRVKYELEVITRNKLSGYFLILWDVMQYCVKNDWLTGVGRGSAAGCIVSYLLGITKIDPIKYDLLFERFYNDGRAGSLPDIDSDFEIEHRDDIIEYIKNKYGVDRVTQILTFQNMKGARALKEVFRAYGEVPFEEINRITKNIIEEHKITDELQAMEEEEEGSASIIRWCLENRSKHFKEWCEIDDEGNLSGPYADRFGQAIRLEGVKAAQSKHAAGIVVSKNPLAEICPMVYDTKNKNTLGGWTMGDMEAGGLVKMDMLGLSFLSKMSMVKKLNPAFNTDFYELEPNDKATWDLFGTGKTKGCFQLESKLGQAWSKKLKPESIEHLSALVAILRPGCISEDCSITIAEYKRKNGLPSYKKTNIKKLHDRFHNKSGKYNAFVNQIISYDESNHKLVKNTIKDIWSNGIKNVYKLNFRKRLRDKNYKSLRKYHFECTDDHKLFVFKKGWIELKNIQKGDRFLLISDGEGREQVSRQKLTKHQKGFQANCFRNYEYKCVFCDWNYGSLDVNHLDGNRTTNNHPDNLCYLCPNHHRMYSEKSIIKEQILDARINHTLPKNENLCWAEFIDYEFIGEKEVYDIAVEGPNHSFIAGDIVVHNCLESTLEDGKSITEHYCMRKNNEEEITYNNEALRSVLEKTYGLLIYQEGAMQLAQKLAGFDLKQADVLRKAIGKKKADLMAKVKTEFFEGVEKVGLVSKEIAEEVFGWIEKSQRYSFNKSHSISYGMLSYLSGYAKTHFPLEFYTAYLAHAQDRLNPQQEIYELINDAKSFGIYVQPPNIQNLNKHFDLIDGKIYFGLADIKHVGESVVDKLALYQDYLDNWYSFLTIVADNINSRAIESLINSGAMDCFKMSRTEMVFQYTIWNQLSGREKKWINNATVQIDLKNSKATLKNVLLALTHGGTTGKVSGCANKNRLAKVLGLIESINNPPYDMHDKPHQIAQLENTLLGICLTATFLDESEQKYMANCSCQEFNDGFNSKNNHIAMAVQIDAIRETTTKKGTDPGRTMAFVTASDDSGICDNIVAFPDSYEKHKNLLVEGNRVLICGTRTKSNSLSIENLQQI